MANPYDDPRYQLARLKAAQTGGVSFGRAVGSAPAVIPTSTTGPSATGGGSPSLLKQVGIGILKDLSLIAAPGRAVVAGIEQAANAIDGDPVTKVSWNQFKSNVGNSEYGFGKAFNPNTDNKWVDRIIGFAGDVAFDPLTYMTFGAGHFAGYSGRLALAGKVLETTGDKVLAAEAARLGRAALSAQDLSRLGLNKSGLYFFGKRLPAIRIPFTNTLGGGAERALARFRIATSETRLGQILQGKFMNKSFHDARLRLARGLASPEESAGIIKLLNWENSARAIRGETLQQMTARLKNVLDSEAGNGFETYRGNLYRVLEEPAVASLASAEEKRAAEVWKNFMQQLYDSIDASAKNIDPALDFGFVRDGYVPRILSEEAYAYLNDSTKPYANDMFKKFLKDGSIDEGGAFKTRGLVEKETFFGHTLEKEDLTISRLNQIAREAGFQGNFFETDLQKMMSSYIEDYSKQVATLSRYQYLKDAGVINFGRDAEWESTFVDSVAVEDAKNLVRDSVTGMNTALEDKRKAIEDLVKQLEKTSKEMETRSSQVESGIVSVAEGRAKAQELQDTFNVISEQLSSATAQLEAMQDSFAKLFYGHNNPWMRQNVIDTLGLTPEDFNMKAVVKALGAEDAMDPMVRQFLEMFGPEGYDFAKKAGLSEASTPVLMQNVFESINAIKREIADLEISRGVNEMYVGLTDNVLGDSKGLIDDLTKRLTSVGEKIKSVTQEFNTAVMDGQMVEELVKKAIRGVAFDEKTPGFNLFNTIRNIAGSSNIDPEVRAKILMSFGDGGTYTAKSFAEWFKKEVAAGSDISKIWDDISYKVWEQTGKGGEVVAYGGARLLHERSFAMSYEQFQKALISGLGHDSTLRDARELAAHLIMRDLRMYGSAERMPEHIRSNFETLVGIARDASKLDSDIEKSLVLKGQVRSIKEFDDKWVSVVDAANTELERFASIEYALNKVDSEIRRITQKGSRPWRLVDGEVVALTAEEIRINTARAFVEHWNNSGGRLIAELSDNPHMGNIFDTFANFGVDIRQVETISELKSELERIKLHYNELLDERRIVSPASVRNLESMTTELKTLKRQLGELVTRKVKAQELGGKTAASDVERATADIAALEGKIATKQAEFDSATKNSLLSPRSVVSRYNSQREKIINTFAGTRAKRLLRLRTGSQMGQQLRDRLLDEVVRYNLVSEINATMDTLSRQLLPLNQVPSEKMYNDVVRSVSKKYFDNAIRYKEDVETAESAISTIRSLFNGRVKDAVDTNEPYSISNIFREVVDSVLAGSSGESVQRILGARFSMQDARYMIDGYTKFDTVAGKALALTEENIADIREWVRVNHPEKLQALDYNIAMKPMRENLKATDPEAFKKLSKNQMTPLKMMRLRYKEEVLIPWFKQMYPEETSGQSAENILGILKNIAGEQGTRRGRATQVALAMNQDEFDNLVARVKVLEDELSSNPALLKSSDSFDPALYAQINEELKMVQGKLSLGVKRLKGSAAHHGEFKYEKLAKVASGRRASVGPFHPQASVKDINGFLDTLLTTSRTMRPSQANRYGTLEMGISNVSVGVLDQARSRAAQQVRSLERLVDPFTDVYSWLDNPVGSFRATTSSGYLDWLDSTARQLEETASKLKGKPKEQQDILSQALQIDKEAEKVQKQIDGLAVSYKPDMAETEFVTRGTREYSQRRAARLAEYQKLISSPEYLKAMKDKETVDVLHVLAGLNLSTDNFKYGFRTLDGDVVEELMKTTSLNRQQYENITSTIASLQDELDNNLLADPTKIREQIALLEDELKRITDEHALVGTPDDLTRFATIERTNPDGTVVREAITFSPAEWRSLYITPNAFEQPGKYTARTRASIADIERQIAEHRAEISKMEVALERNARVRKELFDKKAAVESEISSIENEIVKLRADRNYMQSRIDAEPVYGRSISSNEAARLRARIKELDGQIFELEKRSKVVKGMKTKLLKKFEQYEVSSVGSKKKFVYLLPSKVVSQKAALESEIKKLTKALESQKLYLSSVDPAVRASALEKIDVLVHGRGAQLPVLTRDTVDAFFEKAKALDSSARELGPEKVMARQRAIMDAFDSTPESLMIARANSMHNAYYLEEYFKMMSDKEALLVNAQKVRQTAASVNDQINELIQRGNDIREGAEPIFQKIIAAMESRGFVVPESLKNPLSDNFQTAVKEIRSRMEDVSASIKQGTTGTYVSEIPGARAAAEQQFAATEAGLKGTQQRLTDLKAQTEASRTALTARRETAVTTGKETTKQIDEFKKRLSTLVGLTNDAYRKRWARYLKDIRTGEASIEKLSKAVDEAASNVARQYDHVFTLEEALYGPTDKVGGLPALVDDLKATRKQLGDVLSNLPAGWKEALRTRGVSDVKTGMWVDMFKWLEANKTFFSQLTADDMADPVNQAISRAFEAEGRFMIESMRGQHAKFRLETLKEGTIQQNILKPWEDGYVKMADKLKLNQGMKSLEKLGMPSLYGNADFVTTLENIGRIRTSAVANELSKFMYKYTRFFKAYATATPGFHLRNAISNTFQMFAGGAEVANMSEGLKLWATFRDAVTSGDERAVERWLARVPTEQRTQAEIAKNVYFALGGGRTEEALSDFVTKTGSLLRDNMVLRLSRKTGQRIEGSARFIFAYDSAMKGMEFNDSFARVKRYLFDYNDPTVMDEAVRGIIPFWTWMSRNLPLQIVNKFSNPKAYVIYNHFIQNIAGEPIANMPTWMQESGAVPIGGMNVLMMDTPTQAASNLITDIQKPSSLLGNLNPGIRAPLEFFANKKFFTGQNFSGKYYKIDGANKAVIPLLAAMGQLSWNSRGEPVASDKGMYMLTSLIPTLGQTNRLFPSSEDGLSTSAALNWAGIPIRQVTPAMQKSQVIATRNKKQNESTRLRNIERAQ